MNRNYDKFTLQIEQILSFSELLIDNVKKDQLGTMRINIIFRSKWYLFDRAFLIYFTISLISEIISVRILLLVYAFYLNVQVIWKLC